MSKYFLKKKSSLFLSLLILVVFIFNAGTFAAASKNPMEQLQQSVGEILKILQSEVLR